MKTPPMTIEKVNELLKQGEGIEIEFKTARFDLNKDVFDSICGFLNRKGGHLLFGVNDNREVEGVVEPCIPEMINNLVISANKQLTDGYFDNPNRRNTTLISDPVRDNPFSLAIDVKAVAAYLQGMSSGDPSPKTQQLLHILNALDQVTFAGGGLKGTKVESYFELKMADPSENSLRSMFKLLH